MLFDPRYKLDQIVAKKDSGRRTLEYVNVIRDEGNAGRAIACDSWVAAVVPVVLEDEDVAGLVPAAYFRIAYRGAKRWEDAEMALRADTVVFKGGVVYPRNVPDGIGEYPDIESLIPPTGCAGPNIVALDPGHIARLSAALGVEGMDSLVVQICEGGRPVRVTVQRTSYRPTGPRGGEIGIIQPNYLSTK